VDVRGTFSKERTYSHLKGGVPNQWTRSAAYSRKKENVRKKSATAGVPGGVGLRRGKRRTSRCEREWYVGKRFLALKPVPRPSPYPEEKESLSREGKATSPPSIAREGNLQSL